MKKLIKLFKVSREEWLASAVAMLSTVALHVLIIARYFDLFTKTGRGHWTVFIKNFTVSGFDPVTYSVVTYWESNYNVYRHPLLSFMVWPLSKLDKWLMDATGVNLVQFIVAVPLLFCAFYTFIFLYRTLKDIVRLRAFDSALLSTMLFSFAYVMVSAVVPDHFCISMFLLVFTVYLSGRKMQDGGRFKIWQTVVLFFVTAGVTLSNGVKIYIYSLFTNGRRFSALSISCLPSCCRRRSSGASPGGSMARLCSPRRRRVKSWRPRRKPRTASACCRLSVTRRS